MNTVQHWKPSHIEQLQEIGGYLQRERQSQNLSVDAVSEKTRIRAGIITAIESAGIEQLPEPIYLQGFVRRYGEFLGLDGKALAQSVPVTNPFSVSTSREVSPPLRIHTPSGSWIFRKSNRKYLMWGGSGLLVALFGVIAGAQVVSRMRQVSVEVEPEPPVPVVVEQPATLPEPQTMEFRLEAIGDTWLEVTVDGEEVIYETVPEGYENTWVIEDTIAIVAAQSENIEISRDGSSPQVFGEGYKEASFPVIPQTDP